MNRFLKSINERMLNLARNTDGFTLLETLIALAIMTVAFAAILMVQSGSINAVEKSRTMNIVTMLAKQTMIDAETEYQSKTFEEVDKEASGKFDPPYEDYHWSREIKEIKFPNMMPSTGPDGKTNTGAEMMGKLITNFLSEAMREVTVTVSWPRGKGHQSFSLTTYWVNLNHAFKLTE